MLQFLQENWVLLVAGVVVAGYLLKGPILLRFNGIGSADPAEAVRLVNHDNGQVVDVREDSEWQRGHIPGAVHVPLSRLDKEMDKLGNPDAAEGPIVVACRSGTRSTGAAVRLRKVGFQNVYNLNGGTTAWEQAGMPLEK